ncbi:MAG: hypothetical protein LBQ02_04675 [Candidatus Nomurabacteria bacterium]|nr:hypothetical protein [Candidatus Nomurabacteria bacterium]
MQNEGIQQPQQPTATNGGQPVPPLQPMSPQPVVPPRQPMSPKTKKNIILFSAIGAVVLGLGIAAIFVVPAIFKVDHAGAYRVAKEIKKENYTGISETINACDDMVEYADSSSYSEKTYGEYVTKCTAGIDESLTKKVEELGEQQAVQKDDAIRALYEEYKAEWDKINEAVKKYNAVAVTYEDWHKFKVATSVSLSYGTATDAQIEAWFEPLIKSDNETLKTFGETAKEKTLAAARAYREYSNYKITSYLGDAYKEQKQHKDELYATYTAASNDRENYVKENMPEIKTLAPVEAVSSSNLNTIFNRLYEQVRMTYIEHWNPEDGLCSALLGVPVCE